MKKTSIGKSRFYLMIALLTFSGLMLSTNIAGQNLTQQDINGPVGSGEFGKHIAVLPNGNIVVTDPDYSIVGGAQLIGAAYLYSRTGNLISTLTGSNANDQVGSNGITVLTNGNYVIVSPKWDNDGTTITEKGAVTFGRKTTGVSGVVSSVNSLVGTTGSSAGGSGVMALQGGNYIVRSVRYDGVGGTNTVGAVTLGNGNVGTTGILSSANSLVGSNSGDAVGKSVVLLSNGNYVVNTPDWETGKGAVTFCSGTTPVTGAISSANSFVGITEGSRIGETITPLTNGNYVIQSPATNVGKGAATFGSGTTGITGNPSISNSLAGSTADDNVGEIVIPLSNGNYVVGTPKWDNGTVLNVGAATLGNGANGTSGLITASNSLIGTKAEDSVGSSIVPLTNGNYVVLSPLWDNGFTINVGAATFGSGTNGIQGTISLQNSLIGSTAEDSVGNLGGAFALTNGNYVIRSQIWNKSGVIDAGAMTFGNGTVGISGFVSSSNSLVGSTTDDLSSSSITPLTNGNYIVNVGDWDNGTVINAGAAVFGNGTTGINGIITPQNALVGSSAFDFIGGTTALANGNYVVHNFGWDNGAVTDVGAVTFGNGSTGVTGVISPSNSLVGSSASDAVGSYATALPNGNYVIRSSVWNNGSITDTGAITLGNGVSGITGEVSPSNSLVGSNINDRIGSNVLHVFLQLPNGNFTINSPYWNNSLGAVTYFDANTPLTGTINATNSAFGCEFDSVVAYDAGINQIVVGQYLSNKVTLFQPTQNTQRTKFDFDGDGKSDLSIFRPGPGEWWYLRSSDNGNRAFQFGVSTDKIVPADYTGDGKTDIAFWRPASGEWFVLRSEDSSFYSFPFGANGDIPAPADFDGDGMDDSAIFRPSTATWYINNSSGGTRIESFGASADIPIPSDYDGDGKADLAIWRPNGGGGAEFWMNRSTAGVNAVQFGISTDKPVPGDYTGDGKTDVAFFRPTTGEWFILRSEDGSFYSFPFGANGDFPAPGDYDGDGTFDPTVFRPNGTTWYINGSTAGIIIQGFGASTDRPLANAYVP